MCISGGDGTARGWWCSKALVVDSTTASSTMPSANASRGPLRVCFKDVKCVLAAVVVQQGAGASTTNLSPCLWQHTRTPSFHAPTPHFVPHLHQVALALHPRLEGGLSRLALTRGALRWGTQKQQTQSEAGRAQPQLHCVAGFKGEMSLQLRCALRVQKGSLST